jgi:hypothetical protein
VYNYIPLVQFAVCCTKTCLYWVLFLLSSAACYFGATNHSLDILNPPGGADPRFSPLVDNPLRIWCNRNSGLSRRHLCTKPSSRDTRGGFALGLGSRLITFTFGSKTELELRLVLNGVVFAWLIQQDWVGLVPNPCSPRQLLDVLQANDRLWRERLRVGGFADEDITFLERSAQCYGSRLLLLTVAVQHSRGLTGRLAVRPVTRLGLARRGRRHVRVNQLGVPPAHGWNRNT